MKKGRDPERTAPFLHHKIHRSTSVSRVLYRPATSAGGDGHSSGTPVARRLKRHYPRTSNGPLSNVLLFGLAPDGVYQAFPVTRETGELLPHLFTLTAMEHAHHGGLFSAALSLGSPPVAVSDHPALRSSDFPPIHPVMNRRPSDVLRCMFSIRKRDGKCKSRRTDFVIDRLIGKAVGDGVFLSTNVTDLKGLKRRQEFLHPREKRFQGGALDAIDARYLTDEQF